MRQNELAPAVFVKAGQPEELLVITVVGGKN